MATKLEFSVAVGPVGHGESWPEYYVTLDERILDFGTLTKPKQIDFNVDLEDGVHTINVGLKNKVDTDTIVVGGTIVNDKAVIVTGISIEGYELDDFMHRATYFPIGRDSLKSNYLGWNGEWTLEITTPIFTWIHETQQLGWVYEKNI
jgi:hypothetical protein